MGYSRFTLLTEPARASADLWRLLLGCVVVVAVTVGLSRGVVAVLRGLLSPDGYTGLASQIETADRPLGVLVILGLTVSLGLATIVVTELMHWRGLGSLLGPWPLFRRQFRGVLTALAILNLAVLMLPPWPLRAATEPGLHAGVWLTLLPLTLGAVLAQTASEELFFRGYLQSQIAARFRAPAVWLIVPSVLFALGHYAPGLYGANALVIAVWSLCFGLAAADLTARAGTLAPAIALHLVNNFMALAVVSLSGDMSGLALWRYPFGAMDEASVAALLPADLAMIALAWLAARIALRT